MTIFIAGCIIIVGTARDLGNEALVLTGCRPRSGWQVRWHLTWKT